MSDSLSQLSLFLSHDWGFQGLNHEKVLQIHDQLELLISSSSKVWIDSKEMSGGSNLEKEITEGILQSNVFIIFVTENYQMKYNSHNKSDYCWFELKTAINQKIPLLPILLDNMSLTSGLQPPFGTFIGSMLCIDMTDESIFTNSMKLTEKCQEILQCAQKLAGIQLPTLSYNNNNSNNNHSLLHKIKSKLNDPIDNTWNLHRQNQKFLPGTRQWLHKRIDDWLSQNDGRGGKVCWIRGEAGMGKTVFVASLAERFKKRFQLIGIFFFSFNDLKRSDPCEMIKSLIYQIAENNYIYQQKIVELLNLMNDLSSLTPWELMDAFLLKIVSFLPNNMIHVLILDALDEITHLGNKRQNFLRFLSRDLLRNLPKHIRIIVTGRPEEDVKKALERWDPMIIDENDPNHRTDMVFFIQSQLSEYTETQEELTALTVILMEKSQGKFVYIQAMTEELQYLEKANVENRMITINSFPNGLNEYYYKYLCQLQQSHQGNFEIIEKVFSVLIAAKQAVSGDDVEYILKITRKQRDYCISVLHSLFPYNQQAGHFTIYHKSVVDYLTDSMNAGEFFIDVTEGHQLLANALNQFYHSPQLNEEEGISFSIMKRNYLFQYFLDHLDESSNEKQTFQFLVSLGWLQNSLQEKGMTLTIGDYYKRISNTAWNKFDSNCRKEINIIYRFLKSIAHTSLPSNSQASEWKRMICTEITGRLVDKEEYNYSSEMKSFIKDAWKWLNQFGGYCFLQPSGLLTPYSAHELMKLPPFDKACFYSKDIIATAFASPSRVECLNVYTNESVALFTLDETCEVISIAVLSPRKIVIAQEGGLVSIWDFFTESKISETSFNVSDNYDDIRSLCALPDEMVLISFPDEVALWDGNKTKIIELEYSYWFCYFRLNEVINSRLGDSSLYSLNYVSGTTKFFAQPKMPKIRGFIVITNSETIITFSEFQLARWKAYEMISMAPVSEKQTISICEFAPNTILQGCTPPNAISFYFNVIDINTWTCLQTFPFPTIMSTIKYSAPVLMGIGYQHLSLFDFSKMETKTVPTAKSHPLITVYQDTTDEYLSLPFINFASKEKLRIIAEDLISKNIRVLNLVTYELETESFTPFASHKIARGTLYKIAYILGSKQVVDTNWERFVNLVPLQKIEVWDMINGTMVYLDTCGRLYDTVMCLSDNWTVVKRTKQDNTNSDFLRGKDQVHFFEFFRGSELQYALMVPADHFDSLFVQVYELSKIIILIITSHRNYLWNMELKQLKTCDFNIFGSIYTRYNTTERVLEMNSWYSVVDDIDWEQDSITYTSFSLPELFQYTQKHNLSLYLASAKGTLEGICIDSLPEETQVCYYGDLAVLYDRTKNTYHLLKRIHGQLGNELVSDEIGIGNVNVTKLIAAEKECFIHVLPVSPAEKETEELKLMHIYNYTNYPLETLADLVDTQYSSDEDFSEDDNSHLGYISENED